MKVHQTKAHARPSMVTCNTKECGTKYYVIIKCKDSEGSGGVVLQQRKKRLYIILIR